MAIINQLDTVVQWQYRVTELYLLFQTETIRLLPDALVTFSMVDNYEKNILPIIQANIMMSREAFFKVIKNKDTVKIKIRIQKYSINAKTGSESLYRDYLNKSFSLILDDNNEDMYRNLNSHLSTNTTPKNERHLLESSDFNVELYLFDADLAKKVRLPVNHILQDATMVEAVTLLLTEHDIGNVLMAPIENTKKYETIVIPPLQMYEGLLWLDQFYGLYSTGSLIYFGLTRNYILPYAGRSVAYETNEEKDNYMVVPSIGSSILVNGIGQIKKTGTITAPYIMVDPNTIRFSSPSITQDAVEGLNAVLIDPYNGDVTDYETKATNVASTSNRKKLTNYGYNEYYGSMYIERSSSNNIMINALVGRIDAATLEPNKRYRFLFDDTALAKKYRGNYLLCAKTLEFTKNGNLMDMAAELTFKQELTTSYDR